MAIEDPVAFKAVIARAKEALAADARGRRQCLRDRGKMITLEQIQAAGKQDHSSHRTHPGPQGRKRHAPQGPGVRPEADEGAGDARGRVQDGPEGDRIRHRAHLAQPRRPGRKRDSRARRAIARQSALLPTRPRRRPLLRTVTPVSVLHAWPRGAGVCPRHAFPGAEPPTTKEELDIF